MLEHVDLCERCARKLFPLLEAPQVAQVEMSYVARVVAGCHACKRHAPQILAAQRRFDLERGKHHVWVDVLGHDEWESPSEALALALRQLDWAWIERV